MKKLTHKDLDELAKTMSVLNENEQRERVGGDFYYTTDGTYLGCIGDGAKIVVTDSMSFQDMKQSGMTGVASTGFGSSLYFTQSQIVKQIGSELGLSNVNLYYNDNGSYGSWSSFGGVGINVGGAPFISGNYYDLYLTLVHEKHHKDTPGDFGEAISEYQAYEAVLEHPYFEKASSEYRNIIVERYDYFKKML